MPDSRPQAAPRPGAALVAVDGRTYPLEGARIVARAEGGLAFSTLTQDFRNPYDEPLEVLYTLALPADGAVLGYTVRMGERVIRGEIAKRETAREAYVAALAEGRTAGLLEQDRDSTFTQRLGALPAGQAVRVETEVLHPLDFVPSGDGEPARWEYRFPTVVGVRYEGGPGRVPDASRLDVDRAGEGEIPTRVELELTVADGTPETLAVLSTTHDIRCAVEGGTTRVGLRSGARLDRDLVVRWDAGSERVGVTLREGRGRAGDDGRYGLLTLTPPAAHAAALARDVTVLLDASGSMTGEPLALAKRVVTGLLESLEPGDRFELIAFASEPRRLTGSLRDATPGNVRSARRALDRLAAGGGTEMASALVEALAPLRADSQRQVVLVTDGQISFETEVVGEILKRLPANARVHTVGVGSAPNRALTLGVARAGRGVEVFAGDPAAAAEAARRLCRATVRPVLTELSVTGDAVRGIAPARPRDVLSGQPLVLSMEVDPRGGNVEVSGREAGSGDAWIWRIVLPPASEATGAREAGMVVTSVPLGALYGREAIADLELRALAGAERGNALDARIERAGLRHGITSRMTSLVAVAEEPSVDPRLPRRRERLPLELPAGVSAESSGLWIGCGASHYMGFIGGGRLLRKPGPSDAQAFASMLMLSREVAAAGAARFRAKTPPEPTQVTIDGGRLLGIAADRLTVEFETPFPRFVLPDVEVNVWLDGATWLVARVVPEDSSPRGPHRAGLVVRLTLALAGHPEWLQTRSVELRWLSHPQGQRRDRTPRQLVMSIALPAEASGPR